MTTYWTKLNTVREQNAFSRYVDKLKLVNQMDEEKEPNDNVFNYDTNDKAYFWDDSDYTDEYIVKISKEDMILLIFTGEEPTSPFKQIKVNEHMARVYPQGDIVVGCTTVKKDVVKQLFDAWQGDK